jgi:predicted dehydrogenase
LDLLHGGVLYDKRKFPSRSLLFEFRKLAENIGICLIGAGFMGRAHSSAYRAAQSILPFGERILMQSIVSRSAQDRMRLRQHYGWKDGADDWKAAIQRPDIALVDIATPTNLHAEMTIAALAAGKHVLCEKPLAMDVAEAEAMLAAARSSRAHAGVAFNYRFVPAIRLAKRLIDEGRVGRIYHFRARYLQDWLASPDMPMSWRLDRQQAGSGVLGDLGAHIVDLAHFLVGPMTDVVGQTTTFVDARSSTGGKTGQVTVDDASSFLTRFANGAAGVFEASRMSTGSKNRNQFEIEGDRGALRFDLERLNELEFYSADDPHHMRGFRTILATEPEHPFLEHWWPPGHTLGWEHAHIHLIASFLNDIVSGETTVPTIEDGVACQRVLQAVEQSAAEGRWTTVETRR